MARRSSKVGRALDWLIARTDQLTLWIKGLRVLVVNLTGLVLALVGLATAIFYLVHFVTSDG